MANRTTLAQRTEEISAGGLCKKVKSDGQENCFRILSPCVKLEFNSKQFDPF